MQKILLLVTALCAMAIAHAQTPLQKANDDFKKLDWLEGTWTRLEMKPGHTGYESWKKISTAEWKGSGVNMKGADTAFVEKLKLVMKDELIFYVADIAENKGPVYFKFTAITGDSFVCENPQHDFPKKIAYQKEGNKLKATISGDGKSFDYFFEKR